MEAPDEAFPGKITEEIGGTKDNFNGLLEEREADTILYDDIIEARHRIAHSKGASKSFQEIKQGLVASRIILEALGKTLEETLTNKTISK